MQGKNKAGVFIAIFSLETFAKKPNFSSQALAILEFLAHSMKSTNDFFFKKKLSFVHSLFRIEIKLIWSWVWYFTWFTGPLVSRPPQTSLVSLAPVVSLLGQLLLVMITQIASFCIVQQFPWFTPYVKNEDSNESYENYAVFTLSSMQYVILAVIFSKGPPYRKPLTSNWMLLACVLGKMFFRLFENCIYLLSGIEREERRNTRNVKASFNLWWKLFFIIFFRKIPLHYTIMQRNFPPSVFFFFFYVDASFSY